VSSWLTRAEYDEILARMRAAGKIVLQQGVVPRIGGRFAYLATDNGPGSFPFEIADVMDTCYPLMQMVAEAARGWNGSDPIRDLKAQAARSGVAECPSVVTCRSGEKLGVFLHPRRWVHAALFYRSVIA
jgi:hypothetical protein